MSVLNKPDNGDTITGITTRQSTPREIEVTGRIVGIDPKPPKHNKCDFMYYTVRVEGLQSAVYILSKIPRTEE